MEITIRVDHGVEREFPGKHIEHPRPFMTAHDESGVLINGAEVLNVTTYNPLGLWAPCPEVMPEFRQTGEVRPSEAVIRFAIGHPLLDGFRESAICEEIQMPEGISEITIVGIKVEYIHSGANKNPPGPQPEGGRGPLAARGRTISKSEPPKDGE